MKRTILALALLMALVLPGMAKAEGTGMYLAPKFLMTIQETGTIERSGMGGVEQVRENTACMKDFRPLDETEMAAVRRVQEIFHSKNLIPCTACRYCTDGCPKHISIPDLFAIMNTKQIHHDWNAHLYYDEVHTAPGRRASDCIKCGKCEKACPQHLPIRQLLEQVSQEFDKAR